MYVHVNMYVSRFISLCKGQCQALFFLTKRFMDLVFDILEIFSTCSARYPIKALSMTNCGSLGQILTKWCIFFIKL